MSQPSALKKAGVYVNPIDRTTTLFKYKPITAITEQSIKDATDAIIKGVADIADLTYSIKSSSNNTGSYNWIAFTKQIQSIAIFKATFGLPSYSTTCEGLVQLRFDDNITNTGEFNSSFIIKALSNSFNIVFNIDSYRDTKNKEYKHYNLTFDANPMKLTAKEMHDLCVKIVDAVDDVTSYNKPSTQVETSVSAMFQMLAGPDSSPDSAPVSAPGPASFPDLAPGPALATRPKFKGQRPASAPAPTQVVTAPVPVPAPTPTQVVIAPVPDPAPVPAPAPPVSAETDSTSVDTKQADTVTATTPTPTNDEFKQVPTKQKKKNLRASNESVIVTNSVAPASQELSALVPVTNPVEPAPQELSALVPVTNPVAPAPQKLSVQEKMAARLAFLHAEMQAIEAAAFEEERRICEQIREIAKNKIATLWTQYENVECDLFNYMTAQQVLTANEAQYA